MSLESRIYAALMSTAVLVAPTAAWAAFDQTIVLEGQGASAIGSSQLSFTASDGESVPIREDFDDKDDEATFIIAFPGDKGKSGTLTYPGPDGRPRSVYVPETSRGQPIRIDIASGTITSLPDRSPDRPQTSSAGPGFKPGFWLEGAFNSFKGPRSGVGVTNIGNATAEEYVDWVGGRHKYFGYGGGFHFPLGGLMVALGYNGGKDSFGQSAQVAPGGAARGWVFQGESGALGTGVNLGTLGLDIDSATRVRSDEFIAKIGMPLGDDDEKKVAATMFPYLVLGYTDRRLTQTSRFTTPAFADVNSTLVNRLDTRRFSIGLGYYHDQMVAPDFSIGGTVQATVNFDKYKLNSVQDVRIFNTTDTIAIEKRRNSTRFGFKGEVHANFHLSENIAIGPFGGVRHDPGFGQNVTILSGNQVQNGEEIEIGRKNITQLYAGIRANFSF